MAQSRSGEPGASEVPLGARSATSWAPLRREPFRSLWIATVASNLGTWMHGVGAAWLMTGLTSSPALVAGVQAATSLPMFLLSLPAGALADVVDRRRLLLVTQAWMCAAAAALGLVTLGGLVGPWSLLTLIFLLGLGAALNQPAWQAITPELVPREELPAAVALGSVAFNIARAAGPALGGLVVAAAGAEAAFLLNALSFVGVLAVLYRWRRPAVEAVLPAERFRGAITTGLRYVRHAPEVKAVIARGSAFVLCGSALWALLPVVAREELGRGPVGYGFLLASLGAGAVAGAFALPHLKRGGRMDAVAAVATVVFAGATLALAWVRDFGLLCAALLLAGGAWLSLLSSLNVAVQTLVPGWVRARALSVYMLAFFGALTAGSALWGAVAEGIGLTASLTLAAAGMVAGLLATARYPLRTGEGLDLAPSRQWPAPLVKYELEPERGPVLVTVEYRVPREHAGGFRAAMAALRRIRMRDGAMEWGLFSDTADPELFVEVFLVKSWIEHLRQHERVTIADREIEGRVHALHAGEGRPRARHLVAEPVPRGD